MKGRLVKDAMFGSRKQWVLNPEVEAQPAIRHLLVTHTFSQQDQNNPEWHQIVDLWYLQEFYLKNCITKNLYLLQQFVSITI